MNFFNPLGFLALAALPIIILLYTVKQKSKIKQVSSLYLWDKIRTEKSGTSFFQKLRNNLFLWLNLLAALLVALALTEAYINRTATGENLVIVIDNSLSMQTRDVEPSRLDEAKKQALQLIDGAAPDKLISVVTLNDDPQIIANRQTDKFVLRAAVNGIEKTYGGCDGRKTAALAESLSGEGTRIVVFSDDKLAMQGDYEYINISESSENCAVVNVSQKTGDNGGISVFALVENRGTLPVERNINIFADNRIIDSLPVTIQPGAKTQALVNTDFIPSEVVAEISPKDDLPEDDVRYLTVADDSIKRVLLITKGNVFLEKAIKAQPNAELYKGSEYSGANGYDCYVFDGIDVAEYPTDGDIIIIDNNEQKLFKMTEEKEVESVYATGRGSYFNSLNFDVLKSKGIESDFLEPMLTDGDRTIMASGKKDGRSIFVCGFDLHNSDLPLKMDFPILIYNILNDFDASRLDSRMLTAGVPVSIDLKADTVKAEITDPNGNKNEITKGVFTPEVCGIYTLYENEKQTSKIAVNCVPSQSASGTIAAGDNKIIVNYKLRKIFLILALIVLLAEFIIYMLRMKPDIRVIVLRVLIIALILGSITDFSFASKTHDSDTVFVLDSSESMKSEHKHAVDFINNAMKSRGRRDHTALMVFGSNSAVDSGLNTDKSAYNPSAVVDVTQTDIESAFNTAEGLFSDKRGKHIVLLTDGRETKGNALSIKGGDTYIDIVDFSSELEKEAQISRLRLPSKISKNTNYDITMQIDSLTAQNCGAALYKNDKLIYNETLKLEKGENRFVVKDYADDVNNVVYKCVITPEEDTYTENNTLYDHTYIQDSPVVLVLEQQGSGANIYDLIESFGVNVKRSEISVYSQYPEKLGENDLVILADCSAENMSKEFLEAIKGYVQNAGGGLIATGGENSFALGEYKDTELEEILPVNMEMLNEEVNGDVAFFMVSDRSGSMTSGEYGKTKIEMTKEAMAGAVKNLSENDTVAVLAFDDRGQWIVKPTKVGKNTSSIVQKISGISPGGGTSILPSLEEAYEEILKNDAAYKHIILMTDGQAETTGYDPLIEKMKANNITLSTIAVGADADTSLLEELANKGGGRYYFTDEFSNLPNIFSKEAKLAGRDYINNGTFFPSVASNDEILKNVENIPSLDGYIATKSKETAKNVLITELGEPVLSYWQYGLGKSAAFTSDMQNFCSGWLSASEGRTILRNLVSSTMRRPAGLDGEINYTENGENGVITLTFNNTPKEIKGAAINGKKLEFTQTSIGEFRAETKRLEQGSYIVNATIVDDEDTESVINDGIDIGYSREFDINNQKNVLKDIHADGISFIDDPYAVFAQRDYRVNHSLVLYKWLLPLALVLFLLEIFIRRIGGIKLPEKQPKEKKKKTEETPVEDNTAHMLLSNKRNRNK